MTTDFVWGASALGCWVAGLLFLSSWRQTRDRLLAWFALAFWMLGLNWAGLALWRPAQDAEHYFFLLRLAAFTLIIVGIVEKNRRRTRPNGKG